MENQNKSVLFGLYNDEEVLMTAIEKANAQHLDIMEVFTPFPVHGIDDLLGFSESRLHVVGFIFGAIGASFAFLFMTWVFTSDWPIIFGGKPYFSAPAFIPITFELTVLFASIAMVVTFYAICGLWPGKVNPTLDDRITDDKFCIAFDADAHSEEELNAIKLFFSETQAEEVHTKEI